MKCGPCDSMAFVSTVEVENSRTMQIMNKPGQQPDSAFFVVFRGIRGYPKVIFCVSLGTGAED